MSYDPFHTFIIGVVAGAVIGVITTSLITTLKMLNKLGGQKQ